VLVLVLPSCCSTRVPLLRMAGPQASGTPSLTQVCFLYSQFASVGATDEKQSWISLLVHEWLICLLHRSFKLTMQHDITVHAFFSRGRENAR
jgi:hypothetical protein